MLTRPATAEEQKTSLPGSDNLYSYDAGLSGPEEIRRRAHEELQREHGKAEAQQRKQAMSGCLNSLSHCWSSLFNKKKDSTHAQEIQVTNVSPPSASRGT